MDRHTALLLFVSGAALLALWVDVRFPGLTPGRLTRTLLHAISALAAVKFVVPPAMRALIAGGDSSSMTMLALLGVFLPALIYLFLGAIWLLKSLRDGVTA